MQIQRSKGGESSLCVPRAVSAQPGGQSHQASVCARAPDQAPKGRGIPGLHFPALTAISQLLPLGATAAGSPLSDASRAALATVTRETTYATRSTSPRVYGAREGVRKVAKVREALSAVVWYGNRRSGLEGCVVCLEA